jgi:hypothetical protein
MALDQTTGVQQWTGAANDSADLGGAPAAGAAAVVLASVWFPSAGQSVDVVGDNQTGSPNTYAKRAEVHSISGGGFDVYTCIYTAHNLVVNVAPFTIAIHNTHGGSYGQWVALTFTSDTVFDQVGTNSGATITSGSQPVVSTAAASAAAGTVIAIASSSDNSAPSPDVGWTGPPGWTNDSRHISQSDTVAHDVNHLTFSSAAVQTALWQTHLTEAAGIWSAAIITLATAAAPGGVLGRTVGGQTKLVGSGGGLVARPSGLIVPDHKLIVPPRHISMSRCGRETRGGLAR